MADGIGSLIGNATGAGSSFDNVQDFESHKARIVVLGAGGGGCNTISRLSEMGIKGATTVAMNTDARHLNITKANKRILIGKQLTKGMGAGGYPEVGKNAALENKNDIKTAVMWKQPREKLKYLTTKKKQPKSTESFQLCQRFIFFLSAHKPGSAVIRTLAHVDTYFIPGHHLRRIFY